MASPSRAKPPVPARDRRPARRPARACRGSNVALGVARTNRGAARDRGASAPRSRAGCRTWGTVRTRTGPRAGPPARSAPTKLGAIISGATAMPSTVTCQRGSNDAFSITIAGRSAITVAVASPSRRSTSSLTTVPAGVSGRSSALTVGAGAGLPSNATPGFAPLPGRSERNQSCRRSPRLVRSAEIGGRTSTRST